MESNGTALATREQIAAEVRGAPAGTLPASVQHALAERKARLAVVAKISEQGWGKGLDPLMQRALANYLHTNRLDVTEINVLGGNIYRNSAYWLRRLSEMQDAGLIDYATPDLVQHDERLDYALEHGDPDEQAWAKRERSRRLRARIEHGIPEGADAACVFRVKVKGVDTEFAAAKWHEPGKKLVFKRGKPDQWEKDADPVGDLNPIETVISRALRRAMRFCASHLPALAWREQDLDDAAAEVGVQIKSLRLDAIEQAATVAPMTGLPPVVAAPYGDEPTEADTSDEALAAMADAFRKAAESGADPYEGAAGPTGFEVGGAPAVKRRSAQSEGR